MTKDEIKIPFEDERNQFSATVLRHWGHRSKAMITTIVVGLGLGSMVVDRPLSIQDAERMRDTLSAAISKARELDADAPAVRR